jgi:hypothetical protein
MALKPPGDATVAQALVDTAKAKGASSTATLALLEAGMVESGMRNLDHGDRDSLGVLQQRASWGTRESRLNPAESAARFLDKAARFEPWKGTPGLLAQKVQVSAFPLKYDAAYPLAKAWQLYLGASPSTVDVSLPKPAGPLSFVDGLSTFFSQRHGARRLAFVALGVGLIYLGVNITFGAPAKTILKGAL